MSPSLVRPLVLMLAVTLAFPAAAQIYSWKDKDGKMHFSDVPPPSGEVNVRGAKPRPAAPPVEEDMEAAAAGENAEANTADGEAKPATTTSTPAPAPDAAGAPKTLAEKELEFRKRRAQVAEAEAKARKEQAAAASKAENCARARSQLATLNSGRRIARYDADGTRVVLDEETRAAERERAQKSIETYCK